MIYDRGKLASPTHIISLSKAGKVRDRVAARNVRTQVGKIPQTFLPSLTTKFHYVF